MFIPKRNTIKTLHHNFIVMGYEAQVRFGTQVWVRVWVRDSAIFEKGGCGCGGTRRLKNY